MTPACAADYLKDSLEGRDLVACEVATVGPATRIDDRGPLGRSGRRRRWHRCSPPCKAAPQEHTTRRPTDHARFCARRPSWPRVMSRCRRNDVGGGEHPVSSQASPRWKRAQCDRWWVPCGSSPAPLLMKRVDSDAKLERRCPSSGVRRQCAKVEIAFTRMG